MSVFNPNKTINKTNFYKGDTATVTLSFEASADLINKPSDIMILFDRSDSMKEERFLYARDGALEFIDYIIKASGGVNKLENNTKLGLITFGFDATLDSNLTKDALYVKDLINKIVIPPASKTNHGAAFSLATTVFKDNPPKDQVIVIFTDGETTYGPEPNTYVNRLKKMGVEIFCIGLVEKDTSLRYWSSKPLSQHMLTTKDPAKLIKMFDKIAYEVAKAGAKDVVINEKINNNFDIIKINNPNFGTVKKLDNKTFIWNIDAFGIDQKAQCTFDVKYINNINDTVNINELITYQDRDKNTLIFPNPKVKLNYKNEDEPIIFEDEIIIEGCKDSINYKLSNNTLNDLGRIIQLDIPIKNVCPNKSVLVGVILTELDINGIEHKRGFKSFKLEPIKSNKCENVLVKCVNFVLPESLDQIGNETSLCNNRNFKVRVFVNYLENDFDFISNDTVII